MPCLLFQQNGCRTFSVDNGLCISPPTPTLRVSPLMQDAGLPLFVAFGSSSPPVSLFYCCSVTKSRWQRFPVSFLLLCRPVDNSAAVVVVGHGTTVAEAGTTFNWQHQGRERCRQRGRRTKIHDFLGITSILHAHLIEAAQS